MKMNGHWDGLAAFLIGYVAIGGKLYTSGINPTAHQVVAQCGGPLERERVGGLVVCSVQMHI